MTEYEAENTAFISSLAEGFFERKYDEPLNPTEGYRLGVVDEAVQLLSVFEPFFDQAEAAAAGVGTLAVEERNPIEKPRLAVIEGGQSVADNKSVHEDKTTEKARFTVVNGELNIEDATAAAIAAHDDDDGKSVEDFLTAFEAA